MIGNVRRIVVDLNESDHQLATKRKEWVLGLTIACKSASICSSYRYTSENMPDPGGSNTISISYRLVVSSISWTT
jgi:hypothetical protein